MSHASVSTNPQSESQALWAEVMEMTGQMLEQAQAGEWSDVTAIEAKRSESMERFFSTPVPEKQAATVAEGIRWVMEQDKEIVRLGMTERDALIGKVKGVDTGRRALSAYMSNS